LDGGNECKLVTTYSQTKLIINKIGKGALSSVEKFKLVNIPQLMEVPSGANSDSPCGLSQ
jgi:hypothetical protein